MTSWISVFAAAATVISAVPVSAQFMRRPSHPSTFFAAGDDKATDFRLLPQGEFKLKAGKPRVGLQIFQLYISPDNDWNWNIPISLSTSAPAVVDNVDPETIVADLIDLAGGVVNGQIGYDGDIARSADSISGVKSITGFYYNLGVAFKGAVVPSRSTEDSDWYATINPFVRLDFRVTTKTNPERDDYQGVIHFRVTGAGSLFLHDTTNLDEIFSTTDFANYGYIEVKIGFFPVDGASIDLFSWSTSWGNDIDVMKNRVSFGATLFPQKLVQ